MSFIIYLAIKERFKLCIYPKMRSWQFGRFFRPQFGRFGPKDHTESFKPCTESAVVHFMHLCIKLNNTQCK